MSESQIAPDPVLLESREQARAALAEITDPETIGADEGHEVNDEHVLTLLFESKLAGYPGWRWAATLARTSEDAPVTVLEVELLPGPGSVVAPEWVPWSERLAQYRDAQSKQTPEEAEAAERAAALVDEDDVDSDDDPLENDFSDFDDEIDGVDLDESDDDSDEDDSDDDDDAEDDADDDSDEDRDDDSDDTKLFDEDTDDVDDDDAEDADDSEDE
ncbi:DUF3027 domain-containing protein [Leucobacter sp. NPDC058333]|uniref:DUF3027 domain-containing protein n=1 Tax=Leucobacter sp. NPDC058333 TaxID=3346450 RepID=UPI0036600C80